MTTEQMTQTQSAELTRIEAKWTYPQVFVDLVAWMKNREATEALLLGMLEKLTPAAETPFRVCSCYDPCPLHGKKTPDPPATPQPACEHDPILLRQSVWLRAGAMYTPCRRCQEPMVATWHPASQQAEG